MPFQTYFKFLIPMPKFEIKISKNSYTEKYIRLAEIETLIRLAALHSQSYGIVSALS